MPKKATANTVYFEATLKSESRKSMYQEGGVMNADNIDDFKAPPGRDVQAAKKLEAKGFRVRHRNNYSISAEGPRALWERTFSTQVTEKSQPLSDSHPEIGSTTYLSHMPDTPFSIPEDLQDLIERAYPQRPPLFFESPLAPLVPYYHLRVPSDVAVVLRSSMVHREGVTGEGVLVAMVDTGFYKHPFYDWHGYNYNGTLSPDAIKLEEDANGHGTAEAANIFSNSPNIDFIGVKMGFNPTLAFKTASDLYPAIITNSWGYHLGCPPLTELPNFLKPLEAAVIEAVRRRGITVCFSAGNGHHSFPAMMPDVLAVGGVYAHANIAGSDFQLEASNYASSFDSLIYPGRHVPDVCGLVGMQPGGIYIMLPVPPGSAIDQGLAGGAFPNKDETANNDGWAVISGTSASSPQLAGVSALLKQAQPALSPDLMKAILRASARDVKSGQSNQVCGTATPAGEGHDGATGAGLVDAYKAYQLARSVTARSLSTIPSPR